MTNLTINLVAADGATGSISATLPPINAPATVESYYGAFPSTTVPVAPVNIDSPITVGQQFTVAVGGAIKSVLVYKGEVDTGDMVGLWDANGNLIDHVAMTETAIGWQRVAFTQPWELTAGATYTAGYFTPKSYAADHSEETVEGTQNGITFLANGGVFAYGAAMTFPGGSYMASRYYVDIEFEPGASGQVFTPPPPPTQSPWVPAGYILQPQMSDEFTAANLDISKWWTRYAGSGGTQQNIPSNGEQQLFEESNNHVMTGSSCKLTAYAPTASKNYYSSGMLRGKWAFNLQDYNTGFYIEIKAKMPKAYGSWPAFWFAAMPEANGDAPWPPEMDVAEFMMQNPSLGARTVTTPGMSVKYNNAAINGSGTGTGPWNGWQEASSPAPSGWSWNGGSNDYWNTPVDFSAGFHVFAIHHYPGTSADPVNANTGQPTHHCDYYIDGQKVQDGYYDAGIGADGSSCMLELLLDHAVGGVGGLTPTPSMFPDAFEIMYVRTYISQTDSTALVADTIGQNLMPSSGG